MWGGAQALCSLGRTSTTVIFLLFCACWPRGMGADRTTSILPTYFVVVSSLYHYLWKTFSASLQVVLINSCQFNSVQSLGHDWLSVTHGLQHAKLPCPSPTPGACSHSCPLSQSCHPTICCPLFLLPSIFPSIRVFSSESVLCSRWPKYWSFSFSISPSNEYTGLISFKID